MSQVSYGTITITDTNDIERIYTVYAKSADNATVPSAAKEDWSENVSNAPGTGNYIWQRTVVEKSGTGDKTYSSPVCLTGEEAKDIIAIEVQYGISANWDTQPQSSSWSVNTPSYDSSKPNYWTRTRLKYEGNTYSSWVVNKDYALTEAIYNSAVANSIAQQTIEDSQGAMSQAASAVKEVKRIWFAKATSDLPAAPPETGVTTGSASTYNSWSTVKPAENSSYPYYFYCDQTCTNSGIYSHSEILLEADPYTVNALNVRTKNFFHGKDSTYDGWFASGRSTSEGLDESNAATYHYNARFAATNITLGYNKTPVIDLDGASGAINIYRLPTINSSGLVTAAGKIGVKLNASVLTFYNTSGTATSTFGDSIALASNGASITIGSTGTGKYNTYIDSDSVDIREGQNVLASFGTSTIVGKPNAENVSISSSGIEIYSTYLPYSDSGTYLGVYGPVASFTADSHRLGGPKQGHLTVTNKGLSVFSGDESSKYNEVANFFTRQKKLEYDNYEDEFQFDWKTGTKLNIRFETTKDANTITDPVISCCVEWEEDGDIISTGFTEFSAGSSSLTVDGSTYNFSVAISSVGNEAIVSITSLQNLSLGNDAKFLVKIKYTAKVKGPHYGLGYLVQPIGTFSTALGQGTISLGDYQLALGNYNKPNKDALFVIGNGTSDDDRSNAFTIDRNGNILIDSNSIDIRSEETQTVLTTISGDGLTVNDDTGASVAEFLNTGAQIGKTGESHLKMDYHSMQLIDKEGDTYFYVSDLRSNHTATDEYGEGFYAVITDTYTSNGLSMSYNLSNPPLSVNYKVYIDGIEESDVEKTDKKFTLATAPAAGAVITATYPTTDQAVKAYTAGTRKNNRTIGVMSFAEGVDTTASGVASHAEGNDSVASGDTSHAEGFFTIARGYYSHAEGNGSMASGFASHAEGNGSTASGVGSHAEGSSSTTASGDSSHAQNCGTVAQGFAQTVIGTYNQKQGLPTRWQKTDTDYAFIIGNGENDTNRSNALTVDWSGNIEASGNITSAMSGCGATATISLTTNTSGEKIPITTYRDKVGDYLSISNGGIKCEKKGHVEISGNVYFIDGFTANSLVHTLIKKNSTTVINAVHRLPTHYDYYSIPPLVFNVSAGDILYLYVYNQTDAKGKVAGDNRTWLTVKYL